MSETIFVGHEPNTYKAYKTVGGWAIMFLDTNGNTRNVDGGKVYPNRQNAYARVRRLNHPIAHALKKTGVCEAYWDGKTISAREDENERLEDVVVLSISEGAMPPYFQQDFASVEEVERYILNETAFPLYIDWRKVDPEQ